MVGASDVNETDPEDDAARDPVQQTVPCNSVVDHAGGIELGLATKLNLSLVAFHTPAGTVGPLERGLIKATNSGENFEGWVVGFYGEWSDTLAKLPEKLADAQVVRWQSKY